MKRLFTLLMCVAAMGAVAHADDSSLVEQCINVLLNNNQQTALQASAVNPELDANHDGVITISDVTAIIDQNLQEKQIKKAKAHGIKVEKVIINDRVALKPVDDAKFKKQVRPTHRDITK